MIRVFWEKLFYFTFPFPFSLLKVKTRSFSFLKRISKTVLKELISKSGSILVDCGLRTRSKISSIEEMIVLPEILRFELSGKTMTKPISFFLVEFFRFKEIFSHISSLWTSDTSQMFCKIIEKESLSFKNVLTFFPSFLFF